MTEYRPGFVGGLLDRADAVRVNAGRTAEAFAHPGARRLRLDGLSAIDDGTGALATDPLPADAVLEEHLLMGVAADGAPVFAALLAELPDGHDRPHMQGAIETLRTEELALYGTARSMLQWHRQHRHCAACGGLTENQKAGWARRCGGCGREHFPRVDPVTIFLARHEDKVLVGRQHRMPANFYTALAGFVEPGENIEEAVARELKEEAGVTATRVQYALSQPWPFPWSLMIGCFADVEDPALTIDTEELAEARWVGRDEVRAALEKTPEAGFFVPPPIALAYSLFRLWLDEKGG